MKRPQRSDASFRIVEGNFMNYKIVENYDGMQVGGCSLPPHSLTAIPILRVPKRLAGDDVLSGW